VLIGVENRDLGAQSTLLFLVDGGVVEPFEPGILLTR
jgi:hypothetical protein